MVLSADPVFVSAGGYSTLSWSTENQFECKGSGGWSGKKSSKGSTTVGPLTETTVYTIKCVGPGGKQDKSTTVIVGEQTPPPAPTVSLIANPTSVGLNGSTTLSWSSTDATTCDASDGWSGAKATSGSQTTGPLGATTTFTLTCGGDGGTASQSTTVTVSAASPPPTPTVSLTASPDSVSYNGSSTLTWSSLNATTCDASSDWSGSKALSGSEVRSSLTASSTYILTCTGGGGSASKSVTVIVLGDGNVQLSWTAPTTNQDGTLLTLTSFNIYSAASIGNMQKIASVSAAQTSFAMNGLTPGTYYFAVTAVSSTGAESAFSNIESKTIF